MYTEIDLNRLAVYAIHLLSENGVLVTFENIVVSLFTMFPTKFALVGFEHYPDSGRVNRALLQLRPKYRNWATGSPPRGYKLTSSGVIIAEETAKMLADPTFTQRPRADIPARPRTFFPSAVIESRVLSSTAYTKYHENQSEDIDDMEILELLRAVPHAPPEVLSRYLRELLSIAQESKNLEAIEFLKIVRKQFQHLFSN